MMARSGVYSEGRQVGLIIVIMVTALLLTLPLAAAMPSPDIDRPDRWFDDHIYHHHADLTTELQQLSSDHPNYVTMTSIGTSVRGRELWTMRITDPSYPAVDKARVYIDGEHHGNEYLGGELCILLIHKLLEDTDDPVVQQILRQNIVWITPMLNPDGNARDSRSNFNGIDLNRHYPFEFVPSGSHGEAPAVEPEVAANVAFMADKDLDLYITMHTGIVRLIHSWGYTYDLPPDHAMYESLREMSESYGVQYGQASTVLYIAAGTAKDYGYGALGAASFTYEVDDQQTRQISAREDIAVRLGDELGLLTEMLTVAPMLRANLNAHGLTYSEDPAGGIKVNVTLDNPSRSPANNTTLIVEAYQDGSLVGNWSTMVDVPAGNTTGASLRLDLDEGDYLLRTRVTYPKLLQENATSDEIVLGFHEYTVNSSFGGVSGGWGIGLTILLIALGAAFLYWAHRKGWWRPGWAYRKVMSLVRPAPEA